MLRRISNTLKKSKGDYNTVEIGSGDNNSNGRRRSLLLPGNRKPSAEEDRSAKRGDVDELFEKYAQLLHVSRSPLPRQNGGGAYAEHDVSTSWFEDLKSLGFKDFRTLKDVLENEISGDLVDDKAMLMERVIQLVSGLPSHSRNRTELTNAFLGQLWNSLPHPPTTYMGDEYAYRAADGSRNNPMIPWLGAANTPYARSVPPLSIQPSGLPDAGLIFDSLFARREFKPHPNKVSSVFFDWASLVIHDLFQTDYRNPNINKTSSYLDLSILYGDNQDDQNTIRTFKDGKIKPDSFCEERLQAFPPACCVLMVMLNRFHNHVVENLAAINENGRFNKPRDGLPEEHAKGAWAKYDNDLFQTGRLITCGLFINITLYDYLRTIVNLNRTNSTWCLDPRADMNKVPSGLGNQCSVEFDLAYRWHSAISAKDEVYVQHIYEQLMGKPAADVTVQDLLAGLGKYEKNLHPDPSKRTFANLKRQEDGTFKDSELVEILTNATEDVASCFGARNVPKALRAIEMLGISQARRWNVGSLNEFRKFFGLKAYETFEEINSDPDIVAELRNLYEHPDFVELYPGIVVEEAKEPMVPGVGIAPTYTISRTILSDAVALVRGDRHYTIDYNPKTLTNWGYSECRYDLNINQGCVFYKLALTAFPNHYKPNSIYAHYPMTLPTENRIIMKGLGRESDYSYDKPGFIPQKAGLLSYANVKLVLDQQKDFRILWGDATALILGKAGSDFMLSGDKSLHSKEREIMRKSLYQGQWRKNVKEFYEKITVQLLREKSCKIAGVNQVDITRDVGNLAHVHFAADIFSLPLKSKERPSGIFTEHEMYMIMAVIFCCLFIDADPAKSFPLWRTAYAATQQLGQIVEAKIKSVSSAGLLRSFADGLHENQNALADYGVHMIRRLLESGLDASKIAWAQVLPTAVAMIPGPAQAFTQAIDYYLSEEGRKHLHDIKCAAKQDTEESDEKLFRYCMEAIRLNGAFGSYRKSEVSLTVKDEERDVEIKPGDKIFLNFPKANRDPTIFPEPNEVRLDRPIDSYFQYGLGPHACVSDEASKVALTAMLRVVGQLENLRRAPGPQGQLKKVDRGGGLCSYMKQDCTSYFPFPLNFKVHYDGEIPAADRQLL